jgi:hypothetical protein
VDVRLHQCSVFSPSFPPVRENERDIAGMALCPTLEVVAADDRRARTRTLQHRNSRTDGHTPMYISQRWTKMAIRAMGLGERGCN